MRWLALASWITPLTLAAQSEAPAALDPMSSPYLLKLTGGLLLIVAAVFALAWLLRKLNLNTAASPGPIRIVAAINVGARERILLLQVGDEQILVGMSPGHIARLHQLQEPLAVSAGPIAGGAFAARLAGLMNGTRETR